MLWQFILLIIKQLHVLLTRPPARTHPPTEMNEPIADNHQSFFLCILMECAMLHASTHSISQHAIARIIRAAAKLKSGLHAVRWENVRF